MVVRENGKQGGFHDRERGRGRVKRGRTSWREKRGGGGSTAAGSARGDRHRRRIHLRTKPMPSSPSTLPLRGCRRCRGRRGEGEREGGKDDRRRRLHRTPPSLRRAGETGRRATAATAASVGKGATAARREGSRGH
uniref:Uncharacterized protein n=1 Tax=Oryza sativa subsp. japonica TaxID=39947 RepID=Q6YYH4_ORYSJ|nr:hypothetical protein [Oryza sativa Japonica Group]